MRTRAKVCFVLPEFSAHTHFMYVAEMVKALAHDHEIFLIVERGTLQETGDIAHVYKQRFSWWPLRIGELSVVLLYVRATGYRHMYVHYSFIAALLASWIVKVCGGVVYYWNAGLPWQYRRHPLRERLEMLTYHSISFLVTGAELLRQAYHEQYAIPLERIKVVPNWIDVEASQKLPADFSKDALKQSLHIASEKKVVLFVHRLARRKGSHVLPDIAEAIAKEGTVLVVVGDGPDRKDLETELEKRNLTQHTRLVGWVEQSRVREYFAIADVFVMPSEEEGFPHVILEAMAAGVPFVAFDVGGMRDIATGKLMRYVFPAGDTINFIFGVVALLQSPFVRKELVAAGREKVVEFDKHVVMQTFAKLFC